MSRRWRKPQLCLRQGALANLFSFSCVAQGFWERFATGLHVGEDRPRSQGLQGKVPQLQRAVIFVDLPACRCSQAGQTHQARLTFTFAILPGGL